MKFKAHVANDADAMEAGILTAALNGKIKNLKDQHGNILNISDFINKIIGMLALGTGLGNGYMSADKTKKISRRNDGHVSKDILPIFDEQEFEYILKAAEFVGAYNRKVSKNKRLPEFEVFTSDENHGVYGAVKSENLISGPGIAALAGLTDAKDLDLTNPAHLRAIQFSARETAHMLGRLHRKLTTDVNLENAWDDEAKAVAAKARTYFIAGGFGASKEGAYYAKCLSQNLKKIHAGGSKTLDDIIRIVRVTDKCADLAARSAASLIPVNILHAEERAMAA